MTKGLKLLLLALLVQLAPSSGTGATKKNQLLFFHGIWCPPCNQLEETVFPMPGFVAKARQFTVTRIDADAKASWKLKDQYKIGGYPTIVFATAQGKEIYRVVGYRNEKQMLKIMDLVLAAKGRDLTKACAGSAEDDLWRCALVSAERKDHQQAAEAFKKLEGKLAPGSPRYEEARSYFVSESPTADLKRDGYERLLSEFNLSPRAILWALEYLELVGKDAIPPPKMKLVERVLSQYPQLESDPRLEEFGISQTDLPQFKAMLLSHLGRSEEAKRAWKEASEKLEKAAKTVPKGATSRGYDLERVEALEGAGEEGSALQLVNELRSRFPNEFTFHFAAARLLERRKKYTEALPLAKKGYELAYGDNRIRAATLLIKIYATVPDRASAEKIHKEVTADLSPPSTLEVRTHRYLKALDEALASIPKA